MSDIKIQPSATGSATVTLTAPVTNTARTITLPDATGALLNSGSDLPAANLTGTVADARISTLTASKLTGALPAISAANLTNLPASVGGATGVDFNDSVKARFGASADLEIYHDGSHSYIDDTGTGNLNIKGQNLKLLGSNGDNLVFGQQGGAVTLYHNNAAKFETSTTGITVTGVIAGAGVIRKVYAANGVTMVNGSTSPSNILNSGNGVQVTLQSTSSDVLIFASGSVSKNYNGNDNYSTDIHVSGGNIGSGMVSGNESSTASANQKVINNLTQNMPDDEVTQWSFVVYDSAPGSTTPTYNFIRNGTPSITYTFTDVDVIILEIIN